LKVGTADRQVIAQILSYMGDLQAETGDSVRGIVIAHDFTPRATAASKPVPSMELRKSVFNFLFYKSLGTASAEFPISRVSTTN
jgi:endonuclease